MSGLAVVGTDTGVGKTVVSALLLRRYGGGGRLAYWKPVATGARQERDLETVRRLLGDAGGEIDTPAEGYLLEEPLSPHRAASLEGVEIVPAALVARFRELGARCPLVVEGAGGLAVPLTSRGDLLIDLVAELGLPSLLVARSTLGTINHSLLSLEALRRRSMAVAGVVLVGPPDEGNRRAIEDFGGVRVVAEVPPLEPLDAATLAAAAADFDRAGRLAGWLDPAGAPAAPLAQPS